MAEIVKRDSLLLYVFFSMLFIDLIFRLGTVEVFQSRDFILSIIFILAISLFLYFLISFTSGRAAKHFSSVMLGLITFLYLSQFAYFRFFKTYYSVYSAGNGGQILEFWKDITSHLFEQFLWIAAMLLPLLVLIFFGGRFIHFQKHDNFSRLSILGCFIITQLAGVGTVFASGKKVNSAYDLYYRSSIPLLSVERLGLLTTMRVDLQRLVTGWAPTIDIPVKNNLGWGSNLLPGFPDEQEAPIEYNVMNIDFKGRISNEKNQEIKKMHTYFSQVPPTEKNEHTGKFKGYNLIFITAESFSPYAVHKEITPTLYKLIHEGYHFKNFYNPVWGVSTSDGEYVACTGLLPKSGVWSFQESAANYLPFVMGNQLKKIGYNTKAYHNHTFSYYRRDLSHPNMGYDYKGLGKGLTVKKTWPESDIEMVEKTVPEYIGSEPFHAYYMTVSGHMQYSFGGNYIAWKNKKAVEGLPLSNQAKAYIATQVELDRALEKLLKELEAEGKADRTLIALSADHYPYGLEERTIDELAGHKVEKNFELYKSPFILYAKGMEPEVIDKPASSLDIIPTLSNLLGLEYDSRLLMGNDIFSNSPPLVVFLNKSFITEKGKYNSVTGEFTSTGAEEVNQSYLDRISMMIQEKFYYSAKILETDYYRKIFNP
ncbi:alkaline phosphatase family protein [Neobacillus notoginsengisoli]|uniref:Alkaline phosphatase family protein n=1 Tax=Neobacillus notoginsengisoli TaxID=1578198 RepID=A0A417YWI6_9BACI|nr:alkaline phosphatase family protein [Neobacillus notoginsengisoli]RHW41715.1 alkaline phosphatase family protein [Neobacillus notoginsengisoli]